LSRIGFQDKKQKMKTMLKANLGCGPKAVKGWVNIDKSWKAYLARWPVLRIAAGALAAVGLADRLAPDEELPQELGIRRHDVARGLPFGNDEVDFIYTSHMLEHLEKDRAEFVLRECHRALRPGGVLRLVVPDMKLLVDEYLDAKQIGDETAADRFVTALRLGREFASKRLVNRLLSKGHQWAYDFESLSRRLKIAGFNEVKRCEPCEGETPDLELLDEGELHPDSLYLEARK